MFVEPLQEFIEAFGALARHQNFHIRHARDVRSPHHIVPTPEGFVKFWAGCDSGIDNCTERPPQHALVYHRGKAGDDAAPHQTSHPVGRCIGREPDTLTEHLPRDSGILLQNSEDIVVDFVNCLVYLCHTPILRRFSAFFTVALSPHSKT